MSYLFTVTGNTWAYTVTGNTWAYTVTETPLTPPVDGIQTKAGGYILTKSDTKIQIK